MSLKSNSLKFVFLILLRDVLRKLGQARGLLASYTRIRDTATDPKSSPELANTKSDLEAILEDLTDLDDLDDSVTVVESDPSRYGLSVEEVRRRRGFVEQVRDQVQDLRDSSTKAYNSQQVSTLTAEPSAIVLTFCYSWYLLDQYIQTATPPKRETGIMTRTMRTMRTFISKRLCTARTNN